ncbi:O-antigen ligase family protein [Ideonella sp. A 288]|uniref:O-antigen ligase family protein n=1 Tax=Ideonella sp. A 288 TaxID=1962181 RepID=UPI000B4BC5ED|nr:O-antigen ligase family protein [Ideonella sp. A 288]
MPSPLVIIAALLTAAAPLLAYNQAPSPTLLNQCLAFGTWGGFVLALAPGRLSVQGWPLQAALLALVGGVLWSWGPGQLPSSLALSSLSLLLGAMVLAWAGTESARQRDGVAVFTAFATGLLVAGLLSVLVALVQVFLPDWADGGLIAHSGLVGRAVGNLRQPNHLCSLLLWSVIATVALLELRQLSLGVAVAVVVALVFAVELSASRTGAAGLALLALWGAFGRGLSRPTRALLLATPLIYAASYGAMLAWGEWTNQAFGAEARLAAAAGGIDSPNTRSRIWGNALALIAQQPWTGVGFGEFNLAWSLTPFPGRPTAFFDHTHNLPLQLAVELGLPLASLVLALLGATLILGWRRSRAAGGAIGVAGMSAWMMVLMIALHSQVEYPLWYAYFLLPAAFAGGFCLGVPAGALPQRQSLAGVVAGALLVAGASVALVDYLRVVAIYSPGEAAGPLARRVEEGQHSLLFSYHGDYAAATTPELGAGEALAFERAPHFLMDTRLMMAWARHLDSTGRTDLAVVLAERLREFRNADAKEFFAVCETPGAAEFQCRTPTRQPNWREYLQPLPPDGVGAAGAARAPQPGAAPSATQ